VDKKEKALFGKLDQLARHVADARIAAHKRTMSAHTDCIQALRKHEKAVSTAMQDVTTAEAVLQDFVVKNPALFDKPKSLELFGVKFGYKNSAPKILIDDEVKTLLLIKRHFPDRALVRTKEEPSKEALEALSDAELKRIGVQRAATQNKPFLQEQKGLRETAAQLFERVSV
jgi:hypothetical protein